MSALRDAIVASPSAAGDPDSLLLDAAGCWAMGEGELMLMAAKLKFAAADPRASRAEHRAADALLRVVHRAQGGNVPPTELIREARRASAEVALEDQ